MLFFSYHSLKCVKSKENVKEPSINYVVSRGEGGGQKLPLLLSEKTTKRRGGGQKLLILRRHGLWTAPSWLYMYMKANQKEALTNLDLCVFSAIK